MFVILIVLIILRARVIILNFYMNIRVKIRRLILRFGIERRWHWVGGGRFLFKLIGNNFLFKLFGRELRWLWLKILFTLQKRRVSLILILILVLCHYQFFIREWGRRRWTWFLIRLLGSCNLMWWLRFRLIIWNGFLYSYFECIQENRIVFELLMEQFSVVFQYDFAVIFICPLVIIYATFDVFGRIEIVFFFDLIFFILEGGGIIALTVFEFKHIVNVRHNKQNNAF